MESTRQAVSPREAVSPLEGVSPTGAEFQHTSQAPLQHSNQANQPSSGIMPVALPPETPAALQAKPSVRERRIQPREAVDAAAFIFVVKGGSRLEGRVVDLSMSGCCIHLLEPFPLGIYTRAEVEFRMEGLPFRLGGVIQAIHNKRTVGIRFIDFSDRKRQQVTELMAEIHAMRQAKAEAPEDPPAAT